MFEEHHDAVRRLLPNATVVLSGSASIDSLPAEDVDLVVLVDDVGAAATVMSKRYPPLHKDEWREDWAAFRLEGPPQVDIVVTRPGTSRDAHHRRAWELLAHDPNLLDEYRRMKLGGPTSYAERKAQFFDRIVELLDGCSVF